MATKSVDSIVNAVSTGTIVAIVLSIVCGLATCIGCIVIIVCVIKRGNERRYPGAQGVIIQQPYPYPHSWANDYPPDVTSVSNYPPQYQSDPPSYASLPSAPTKSPYT